MKKALSLLMAIVMTLGILAGCAKEEATTQTTAATTQSVIEVTDPTTQVDETTSYKTAIKIATTGDMPSACPYGNSSTQTSITTNSTFNKLVKVDSQGNATDDLATSWESNDDSSVWTFHLREGVTFHDGSTFTSADVKFTWEYASTSENAGMNWPITGADLVDSIECPDDYTVVFNMKASTPDWLLYAAQKIMSKTAVETEGIEKGGIIGTGPYYIADQETGVSWTIRRNENYFGELPVTEEITFVVITDASARALTLKSGDVDAIFEANASDIVSFIADGTYNVYKAESLANVYIGMNCSTELGGNEIVRRAVAMAVNRDDIVNACYENGACAVPSFNVINNVTPGYVDVDAIAYDPEGAMTLLAENGLENITLNLTTFAKYMAVAEVIQADLSMVGINVEIRELAQSGFTGNLRSDPEAFDMYINATSSTGGILNIMSRFFVTDANASAMYYSDAEFDALYEQALASDTYEGLLDGFAEMQNYLAKTVPAIPLVQVYQWCIGSSNFYGVSLGNQTYAVDFTNCYVVQ